MQKKGEQVENLEFQREHHRRARRARIMAQLSMRTYQRELGGYRALDLTRGLDSTFFLVEKLRYLPAVEGCAEANELISNIQAKIGMASLGATTLLGTPAPSTKYSK